MIETAERFPRLLTVPEAAKAARISVPTLYRRIANGEIPGAIRVGQGHAPIRIVAEEFRRWVLGEEAEA